MPGLAGLFATPLFPLVYGFRPAGGWGNFRQLKTNWLLDPGVTCADWVLNFTQLLIPPFSFLPLKDFCGNSHMVGPAGPAGDDMTEQKSRGSICIVRAREGTHAHSPAPRYPRHGGPRRGGRPTRPRRAVRQRRWTGGHPPGSNAQGFWTRFCSARRRRAPAASCTRRGAPDGGYAGFARRRQET